MAKAAPIITSFLGGEASPLMAGRVELKNYQTFCRKTRNFIPALQGPARRRPGTRFVAEVKSSANRTWLARFEFNVEQAYVLEFGDFYIRFFANHGVVGAPFEVVTPWAVADLTTDQGTFNLRFVQSNDILYIVGGNKRPQKLSRLTASTFSIAPLDPTGGPFKGVDSTNTVAVWASAATGAGITLTASSAIFLASHVGSLFLLEEKNTVAITMWEPGKVVALGATVKSDGKNYSALNAATTGTIRPVHSYGARFDGIAGVQWQFDDPGFGWCKITAIGGGGTTATVDVLSRIPANAVGAGNPTTRWSHSAWSDEEGWPDNITFFRERLCLARDRNVWQSVAGDFEDFRSRDDGGLVTAEMAISSDITSDRANKIEWLAPSDTALLIGTAGDESAISEIATTEAFGPANAQNRKQHEYGSRHVPVCRVGDGIVFAQKAGRKVRDMRFSWEKEGYRAADLTVFAEHITKSGIVDMAYQQEPDSIIWLVRGDGTLLGLTLNREQEVQGWHPHRIGGFSTASNTEFAIVESVTTIPSPDGDRDEVWMIVRRVINGVTRRYIEWMEYHHEQGDDPEDAFYVDSGLTLDNVRNATLTVGAGATVKGTAGVVFDAGSPIFIAGDVGKFIHYRYSTVDVTGKVTWKKAVVEITQFNSNIQVLGTILSPFPALGTIPANDWRLTATVLSGLTHLIGQTVQIWADGASHPDRVVSGAGTVTLQLPASKCHVGEGCPAVLQPMPIEAGSMDGTAQGKSARISRCGIRFHETAGCRYGRDETGEQLDNIELRASSTNMDEAPPLFTGDEIVSWPDGYEGPAIITVVQDIPGPCTVVALMPQITVQDNR